MVTMVVHSNLTIATLFSDLKELYMAIYLLSCTACGSNSVPFIRKKSANLRNYVRRIRS